VIQKTNLAPVPLRKALNVLKGMVSGLIATLRKSEMLKIKECKVGGQVGFGVTDGKKWFSFAYTEKYRAESVLVKILANNPTQESIKVNIDRPEPIQLV
jgi:hypothetical protein